MERVYQKGEYTAKSPYRATEEQTHFTVLFIANRRALLSFLQSFVKDKDVAEDLLQDVYLRAFNAFTYNRKGDRTKFISYLFRISRNLAIDYLRRGKLKEKWVSKELSTSSEMYDLATPYSLLLSEQRRQLLYEMMQQLPNKQQEVIELYFFHGLTCREISKQLQVKLNTILGRMRYGLQKLRTMCEQRALTWQQV